MAWSDDMFSRIDFVAKFQPQMQCWQMHDGNYIKFTEQLFYSITTNVPVN